MGDLKYTAYRLGNLSYIAKLLGRNLNKLEQNLFTIIKYSNNKSISDLVKENKLESSTNNKKKVSKQELLELYLRGDSIAREFMKQ